LLGRAGGLAQPLAEACRGKPPNSPNDTVCQRDGMVWLTDPPFGILGWWEGEPATPELPHGVYRIDAAAGADPSVLDACVSTMRRAPRWRISTCPNAAPTCASAARR
jgi:sugar lactone lactonase YvrE